MKATINELNATFNFDAIAGKFEIFKLTTTEKYIPSMAYTLDKPVEKIKAKSLVYEPKTKSAFALFDKGAINRRTLEEALEDPTIIVSQVRPEDVAGSYLVRLFLSALGNYSGEFQYNNVNGRFFITDPKWVSKNKKYFVACEFKVDQLMVFTAHAVSFTSVTLFPPKKISSLPRYAFGGSRNSPKRALASESGTQIYVPKAPMDGTKAYIDFLRFDEGNTHYERTRAYLMFRVLDIFNMTYKGLIGLSFKTIEIAKTIGTPSQKKFMDSVLADLRLKNVNLVNLCGSEEDEDTFQDLFDLISHKLPCSISKTIDPSSPNVVFIHEKGHYLEGNDPYSAFDRSSVIQAVTVEDAGKAIGEFLEDVKGDKTQDCPVVNTILKELDIKDNLKTKALTMDDWAKHGFKSDYVFGSLFENRLYFLKISKEGHISYVNKDNDFSPFFDGDIEELSEWLQNSPLKGKYIVKDDLGNVNVIGRTDLITLPSPDVFTAHEVRGKAARPIYFPGVVDINFYQTEKGVFYNVGPQGSGMKRKLPKASRIYQVEIIKGEEIMSELLPLMAVAFVKYGDYTVLPYPFKYLREYIEMAKPKEKER